VALGADGWEGRVGDGLVQRSGLEKKGVADLLEKAGEEEMKATEISFCEFESSRNSEARSVEQTADFLCFSRFAVLASFAGVPKIPFPSPRPEPLELNQCLGSWWMSEDPEKEVDAVFLFRHLAFEDHYCGDLRKSLSPLFRDRHRD